MVRRRIHFYRVHPQALDYREALRTVEALPLTRGARYLEDERQDTADYAWFVRGYVARGQLVFGRVRRQNLPQIDEAGRLRPLRLRREAGLFEPIHVVFFGDGLVGADFNFYGPRMKALAYYLYTKAPDECQGVSFNPLLKQDVMEQLDRLREIRMVTLRIRADTATRIRRGSQSLAAAFEQAHRAGGADELEIVLRNRRFSRRPLPRARRLLERLLLRTPLQVEAEKFKVKGVSLDGGGVTEVDLLHDQFAVECDVQTQDRTRTPKPESVFREIRRAFTQLRDELVAAPEMEG